MTRGGGGGGYLHCLLARQTRVEASEQSKQSQQLGATQTQERINLLSEEVASLRVSNAALQVEAEEATSVLRDKTQALEKTEKHVKMVIQQVSPRVHLRRLAPPHALVQLPLRLSPHLEPCHLLTYPCCACGLSRHGHQSGRACVAGRRA